MMKSALFAAAAILATAATTAPVLAKDVAVRHGDLDLSTDRGQTALASRIDRAAKKACDFDQGRIADRSAMECYRQAHTKAGAQVAALVEDSRLGG